MVIAFLTMACALALPGSAAAANKEHQQIMAELRMLQEQQAQLMQTLYGLGETLKVITTRLDEQSTVSRKAFADQKLLIDNVAETTRILREKADDTNVRLSNVSQELQALRQTVASMPPPTAAVPAATGDPGTVDPAAPPTTGTVTVPPPNVSPSQYYDRVFGDYAAGQYDLAISGFESFIRLYPTSPQADDAQLMIGNSYYNDGKFQDALAAYQKVISLYPQGDQVPTAHYKIGRTYEDLQQIDLARKTYEMIVKTYPKSVDVATLAQQRLDALNRKREAQASRDEQASDAGQSPAAPSERTPGPAIPSTPSERPEGPPV
jgi:tol-pal system protein YbgF